ncbi:MAG: hypothetical protein U0Y10_22230 [Spirosomataceae bacterium]
MKLKLVFLVLTALIIYSCKTSKKLSLSRGEVNDAIQDAIADFLRTKKILAKQDSVFSIYVENINDDVLGIGISGERDKIALFTKNEIDYDYRLFPTRIYEQNGKMFFWKDSTASVSKEVIDKLYALNRVDTTVYQKKFPERTIDEMQKVVHYYYCKNNLNSYQKKKTSIAMFRYEIPKIECKKSSVKSSL